MNRNFLKIAFRYLWRNRTYSILNYACLTFGLTCTILASLFILNVLSWDKFHTNYHNIYEVEAYVTYFNGDYFPKEYLSASLSDELKQQAPEFSDLTRVSSRTFSFSYGEKTFDQNGIYADNNFFDIFTFPLIEGDLKSTFSDNNSIIISERMANKFFKNNDCLGQTLTLKDGQIQQTFKITGILKNVPSQSWMQFDFVLPFSKFLADNHWANDAGATATQIWALMKPNYNKVQVENKIKNIIKNREATLNQELMLFPLNEKMLYRYTSGKRTWDEMQNLVIIGCVAFAILLIACFNFINLAISLNIKRYREAGIKKVVGSSKRAIVRQFMGETFLLTIISFLSALLLSNVLLPIFNTIFHQELSFSNSAVSVIVIFTLVTLFTGFLSGLFPSLYLSSSNPLTVLKGKISTSNSYSLFRQGLIVTQFTVPIVLIICMMIFKTQDRFMRSFDTGIDKDKVIVLNNTENIRKHSESVRTELLSLPGIDAVSFTSGMPTRTYRPINEVSWEGKQANEKQHFWCVNSDFDYNKIVKVKLTNGRFFDKSFTSDSACYLINDVAANVMKYNKPIGASITVEGKKGSVIGTFTDFHAIDLSGPIVPTIIRISSLDASNILIKFSSGTYPQMAERISKVFKKYDQEGLYQPHLFREFSEVSQLKMPSNLIGVAFIIALLLACMGLFGLASFTVESRTKEIGIRKTNGATIYSVMHMLLSNYTRWLSFAFLIALPFAFLLGKIFLDRFYFHTPMPLWAFIAGPAIAYLVAIITVSGRSFQAASRNPVDALRYE